MAKIKYELHDGRIIEIDVPDSVAAVTVEIERQEQNAARRDRWRKETSIDVLAKKGYEPPDRGKTVIEMAEAEDDAERLQMAVRTLSAAQQDLLKKIYYEEQTLDEIARAEGVTYQAIQNRQNKILKKLKKILD